MVHNDMSQLGVMVAELYIMLRSIVEGRDTELLHVLQKPISSLWVYYDGCITVTVVPNRNELCGGRQKGMFSGERLPPHP